MTHKAREVLDDCRLTLLMLEEETDFQRWRIHWAAAVALIRAVGHVLRNVDGADPVIKKQPMRLTKDGKAPIPSTRFLENSLNVSGTICSKSTIAMCTL